MMITNRYAGKEDGDEKETKKLKLTGAVDEVLLFNRALSSAEVSAVAGKVVTTKTLGISGDAKKAKKKGKTVITVICGKSKKKVNVTVK